MNRRALIVALAPLASASVANAAAFSLIDDQDMPTANWTAISTLTHGGFGFGAGRSPTGGNPGAYRTIFHNSSLGPADGYVLHLHAMRWTPSTQGAIGALDMAMHVNVFSSAGATNAAEFGLIVVQSGQTYVGPTLTLAVGGGWGTPLFGNGLGASAFDLIGEPTGSPDFSSVGEPITFGFYSRSTSTSSLRINVSSGADNFRVTVFEPIPSPGGMAAMSVLCAGSLRRRRKAC